MKKLINAPEDVVSEALAGMAAAHADLIRVHADPFLIVRADAPIAGKVGIISGGGSGHEPMHGGFVGRGMLDAACPGHIFTSPVPDQILAAIHAVDAGRGVLQIVKNYTGDVMNFAMAAELAAAEGIQVATVVTDDDVAVENSTWTAGRRGVGITVLLEKIVGAAAEAGADLATLTALAQHVNAEGRSMGMALTACTVPHVGRPGFDLPEDEIELGIGIHGEPGRHRVAMAPAAQIAAMLATPILEDLPFQHGDQVLAFVNGMGGTPLIELYVMYHELNKLLTAQGIHIRRRLIGNYITALDMAGCAFTLLRLDDHLTQLWDAPVLTPALRWGI
ncbi:dihydroxyacetone kinase subunit DhaK [Candidatus Oscillochloris fontis]|uniref:dihydroxyacetone kinase subunit DhaK n=1 Tax=Candidatus Oscillochloris fontis TaxID=2496868 RepID=UPI00101CE069|nr:dihydroxyacetone kinase subunit DhaK [Candidatus Oscillochloris fontis]